MSKQEIELTLAIIICLVIPLGIIIYDRIKHKRWYDKQKKFIFLRLNTQEIRNRLSCAGFQICSCCEFDGSVWLNGSSRDGFIHGIGYPYEDMPELSPKEVCALTISDEKKCGNIIVDCGTDVERFIKEVKRYNKVN